MSSEMFFLETMHFSSANQIERLLTLLPLASQSEMLFAEPLLT